MCYNMGGAIVCVNMVDDAIVPQLCPVLTTGWLYMDINGLNFIVIGLKSLEG